MLTIGKQTELGRKRGKGRLKAKAMREEEVLRLKYLSLCLV